MTFFILNLTNFFLNKVEKPKPKSFGFIFDFAMKNLTPQNFFLFNNNIIDNNLINIIKAIEINFFSD